MPIYLVEVTQTVRRVYRDTEIGSLFIEAPTKEDAQEYVHHLNRNGELYSTIDFEDDESEVVEADVVEQDIRVEERFDIGKPDVSLDEVFEAKTSDAWWEARV